VVVTKLIFKEKQAHLDHGECLIIYDNNLVYINFYFLLF